MENDSSNNFSDIYAKKEIKKLLKVDETILLFEKLLKINHYGMHQERNMLITNQCIYNLKKFSMKRAISFDIILGITANKLTDEFIIHGRENEYDYFYISHNRNHIIEVINNVYTSIRKEPLTFCLMNEKSLKAYVTTKKEKKSNPNFSKMKKDFAMPIADFLSNNFIPQGELNLNGVIGPQDNNKTVYTSHKTVKEVKLEDFKVLKVLGRGSFGKVCLVEYLPTHETYAMKSLKKDILIEQEQIDNTILEKEILQSINHPLLCGLVFCFQTFERIYFVMPFLSGGELFQHLKTFRTFDEKKVQFYGAQIAMALDYLHSKGIIYRDLKPENILMDDKGYLRLADFGMAKKLKANEKAMSFCGTPEYLAPEIINQKGHDKSADWWSFGILLYEMLCGLPPFYTENVDKMYLMIQNSPVKFPKRLLLSENAKDIIKRLLEKDPEKRLGSKKGLAEIKTHPFFINVDFDAILNKQEPAPFVPTLNDNKDVQYFDEEFTNEDTGISIIPKKNLDKIKKNQNKFKEFNK
jgi:serum/glucocorticoid-regulated kinase 2